MNYYYDLPTDIINIIDDKVNNMYKEEHKKNMKNSLDILDKGLEWYIAFVEEYLNDYSQTDTIDTIDEDDFEMMTDKGLWSIEQHAHRGGRGPTRWRI